MKLKRVKCQSGIMGTQCKLRDNYDGDAVVWEMASELYGLHTKLGYETPELAWADNPTIQVSVNPSDFRKVKA